MGNVTWNFYCETFSQQLDSMTADRKLHVLQPVLLNAIKFNYEKYQFKVRSASITVIVNPQHFEIKYNFVALS